MIIYTTDERSKRAREDVVERANRRIHQLVRLTDGHSGDCCPCPHCFDLREIAARCA